jgi:hypothetical protein
MLTGREILEMGSPKEFLGWFVGLVVLIQKFFLLFWLL